MLYIYTATLRCILKKKKKKITKFLLFFFLTRPRLERGPVESSFALKKISRIMAFEATLGQGEIFKKIIFAIVDLVQDGNFECDSDGIRLQAMDTSHVSLVSLFLNKDSFDNYKCETPITLGINFQSLTKVLKCSKMDDSLHLSTDPSSKDELSIVFSDKNDRRTSTFQLKLMEIDSERLVIPETNYVCEIVMSSKEFKQIMTDLHNIGESLTIGGSKEGVRFAITGEIGSGDLTYRNSDAVIPIKKKKSKKHSDDGQSQTQSVQDDKDLVIECEDDTTSGSHVKIQCEQAVTQNFALKYLVSFTKGTTLSPLVHLSMSPDIPLVVRFDIETLGYLKYYLAPKIDDE
ncbi:hypothetical protein RFI_16813 [Reticulomyxa filosa]|uniref:DNA sliding clamp PCNA n=1 Tax=Reticulomyxa filosa TaxID=46433 RepID=X6N2X9_RETFI|nr:hypothetical protein RFI_16813 [Reticulomyxa filosa]|eukprot:ETO20401.1 hypothetical protein RFI_16813 [Reticulomyxa filosa]